MKSIIISGYYGFGNIGDEAILSSMIKQIEDKIHDSSITVISGNIEETKRLHKVNAINRYDFTTISNRIEKCDLVILGGGGLFQDHHKINIADIFTQPGYGISSYAIEPLIAKMHNKPVIYYSQGIGPLFSKESRTFVALAAELADIITVRDIYSEDLLIEIGVPSSKIKLGLDPSFDLDIAPLEIIDSILTKEKISLDKDFICVVVRQWIDKHAEENYKKALSEALDIFLDHNNLNILFIPFKYLDDCDEKIEKEIIEMMKNKDKCYILKDFYHPKEIAGIISKASLIIGMRYHSIVFSIISKIPFVALSYDIKIKNLTNELGLEEYCIEIDSINTENICNAIAKAVTDTEKFQKKLESFVDDTKERLDISPNLVQTFIKGPSMPSMSSMLSVPKLTDIHLEIEKMKLLDTIHNQTQIIINLQTYHQQIISNLENQIKGKSNDLIKAQEVVTNLENLLKDKSNDVIKAQEVVTNLENRLKDLEENRLKDLENRLKDKSNDVIKAQEVVTNLENRLKDKSNDVIKAQEVVTNLENRLKDKSNDVIKVQEVVTNLENRLKDLENQLKDRLHEKEIREKEILEQKDLEICRLQEILYQRESSLAWRFSQFYGKYVGYDTVFTRILTGTINKALYKINKYRNKDSNIISHVGMDREGLNKFLTDARDNDFIIIFSATKFVENEGQRPTRLAKELANRGIYVLFAYWRWSVNDGPDFERKNDHISVLAIDQLLDNAKQILEFKFSKDKLFLMEFPHPYLFELASLGNSNGWINIYDVLDDWKEFYKVGQADWYDEDLERYLMLNSDIIMAVSPRLVEKLNKFGDKNIKLIPNAVDPDILIDRPKRRLKKGRITIGYFGHLTSSWFDWDLIVKLADKHSDWIFHIIGYGEPKIDLPANILLHGKVEPQELSSYVRNWDVAIIPFKVSNLSESVDPIKIYEYLYFRLPVVVQGISHLSRYPYVLTSNNFEDFEKNIELSFKVHIDKLDDFIENNNWKKRVGSILEEINRIKEEDSFKKYCFEEFG